MGAPRRVLAAGITLVPTMGSAGVTRAIGPKKSRVALVTTNDRKRGVAEVLHWNRW